MNGIHTYVLMCIEAVWLAVLCGRVLLGCVTSWGFDFSLVGWRCTSPESTRSWSNANRSPTRAQYSDYSYIAGAVTAQVCNCLEPPALPLCESHSNFCMHSCFVCIPDLNSHVMGCMMSAFLSGEVCAGQCQLD